jgi:hypothetical protein
MSTSTSFFKESVTSMGVFYPMHYLVAVFPDLEAARKVRRNLLNNNFHDADVLAISGRDFIELEAEASGVIMKELSRFFKTEQLSTDHNLELAEHRAGFLFAHCPSDQTKAKAWAIIQEDKPMAAHHYDAVGIDALAGGLSTD